MAENAPQNPASGGDAIKLAVAWLWVGIPLVWGVTQTLTKALALFK